ncbi:single-stranded-DNA-specific exonuclease C-terminal domain-containing protein [Paracerasibacillus soli]|uniref:Single-stranded-DNA-specific exonuclease C-terminal domain-containing protein n=1 Tax=Paracerasibacillus soli TaxID=480284 RepID=A0ABU5CQC4_9BACI|nr:single-stranded-DNA-specific exonuclease C-terminal domain-containing protein [Virgibacillus soli]MDY0408559.1 single-stranded-DNA-specific exonuclease C-terminal domain-containing protein [Virgibacillus soli]
MESGSIRYRSFRLVKKFDRPAIVLTIDETTNIAKGSARSIPAFDLFTNCMEIKSLFTHFGGHAQAAGMTLPIENISTIQKKLHTLITSQLDSEDFKQQITISQTLAIADINAEMIEDTRKLAPFGMANPKPVFHIRHIPSDIRQLGNMKKHLKMQFQDDGVQIEGIGFGWGNQYDDMTDKVPVSIVGELGFNEWNGMKKIQMMIQDINIDQWQLFDFRGKRNATLENYIKSSPSVMLTSAHSLKQRKLPNVTYLTYEEDMPAQIVGESLFILELPPTLQKLQHIVTVLQPKRIYVCFYVENSTFLSAFPSRNDFKWYYAVLVKERKLQVNYHLNKIMQTKKWSKEKIVFMSKVFFELEFVNIENGVIELNPNPIKKDLTESRLYQNRVRQAEIEQILYYSTYDELYQWFSKCLDYDKEDTPKEEVNDGLQTIY